MQRFLIALGILVVIAAVVVVVYYPRDSSEMVRARVIASAEKTFPDFKFSNAGDVTLFAAQGDGVWSFDITTVQQVCQDGRNACDRATASLMQELKRAFTPGPSLKVTDLRPTLSGPPKDWPPAANVVVEPLAGTLQVRYGFFTDSTVRFLTRGLATQLGLDPARIRAVSVEAMQSAPGAPILRPLLGHKGLSYLDGEADPAGEVLSAARLSILLERTGLTQVALGFPTRHMVVVANASVKEDVQMLRGFVDALTKRPQAHVVSRDIYRFDGTSLTEIK